MTDVVEPNPAAVHPPAEIERWAEDIRQRIVGDRPPQDGVIKSPDSIIADLEVLKYVAGQNVVILREAERTRSRARRIHALAVARATKKAEGKTVAEREADVVLATAAEADAAEDAEIAYSYAKRVADLTESAKSATQTQAKQVEITYALAGTGRRQ